MTPNTREVRFFPELAILSLLVRTSRITKPAVVSIQLPMLMNQAANGEKIQLFIQNCVSK